MYRIRLDLVNDLNSDSLIDACGVTGDDEYVIVRHELPHGNPHLHAYIKMDIKENTLRQRIKRKLTNIASTDYSIKQCDPHRADEYVQYMFNTKKGNVWELIATNKYDELKLNDLKAAAQLITDEYASSRSKSKRNTAPTIWDMAEELQANIDERKGSYGNGRGEDFPEDVANESKELADYTDTAIYVLRKYKKAHDEFLIRKLITTALTGSEKGKKIFRLKMIKNFTSHY